MKPKTKRSSQSFPKVGEGIRGVAGHHTYLLRQAAAAVRSALEDRFAIFEITHPQFVVLAGLSMYPGASGADLAKMALLTPQTMTVITKNLERAGLIRRKQNSNEGRRVPYELTPKGNRILASCFRVAEEVEQAIQDGLPSQKIVFTKRWLVAVAERLQS